MALSDTAEYWNDVKKQKLYEGYKCFTHLKNIDCGHNHKIESDEYDDIDCYACKKIIDTDVELKNRLISNNGKRQKKAYNKRKKKKGYKLKSIIKFGKYKGHQKTIQWIIKNDTSYFEWLKGKILLNKEVDNYISS